MPSILVHGQGLLGIGHLQRLATLCQGLSAAGFEVHFAYGGALQDIKSLGPTFFGSGVILHQLPVLRTANAQFNSYLDAQGQVIDQDWRHHRRQILLDLFTHLQPNLLLLETFPFGRRVLRFELEPLLAAAAARQPRPAIFTTLRDILVPARTQKQHDDCIAIANHYLDGILIHGDRGFTTLADSFPQADRLRPPLFYTGYIHTRSSSQPPNPDLAGAILVSSGGGAVGGDLMRMALEARPLTKIADKPWRLFAGPHLPAAEYTALQVACQQSTGDCLIMPNCKNFDQQLHHCFLSISQAGYNTSLDIITAGCRAVVVPFSAKGRETEQSTRATLLAKRGLWRSVPDSELTAQCLAQEIDLATIPNPSIPLPSFEGIAETISVLKHNLSLKENLA